MENFLFKKSYQLKNLSSLPYESLWGFKGIFTTVRLYGNKNNYILIDDHIKNFNESLKIFNIPFILSKQLLINLIHPQLKLKKYDHLLRIACNRKILSISLRKRKKILNNFSIILKSYQRPLANFKHLNYKKILSFQNKINLQKEEIVFYKNQCLFEGSTSNLIAVKKNILFVPIKNYYFGVTLRYLISKTKMKVIKNDIKINNLSDYSELILVGSGKEVVSVSSVNSINWNRTSDKIYKKLNKIYNTLLNK